MKTDQGFIKWIVLVILGVVILSLLGIDIKEAIESPTTQHNFSYLTQAILWVWNTFLKDMIFFIWERAILPLIHTLSNLRG